MKCIDFNKYIMQYIEKETSGSINSEMLDHMEHCIECKKLHSEKLQLRDSFDKLYNGITTENMIMNEAITSVLDSSYYNRSLNNKLRFHLKRKKSQYSLLVASMAILLFTFPLIRSVALSHLSNEISGTGKQITDQVPLNTGDNPAASNHIVKYDIKSAKDEKFKYEGKLLEISNPLKIKIGYSVKDGNPDKTTSEIAKENSAVAAINASKPHIIVNEDPNKYYSGLIISENKVLYNDISNRNEKYSFVGINNQGLLVTGNYSLEQINTLNIREGVCMGISSSILQPLIIDGKAVKSEGGVNPRTAIGQKADGTIIMLTIDGRSERSLGIDINNLQRILLEHGAVNAASLSGGSETTMFYNGEVINNPCDPKSEQKVSAVFMVMPDVLKTK